MVGDDRGGGGRDRGGRGGGRDRGGRGGRDRGGRRWTIDRGGRKPLVISLDSWFQVF